MINLILGAPGGGKSYEAVVFHILPALKSGRKVITNLPLLKDGFDRIDMALWALVELREKSLATTPDGRSKRAFSDVLDYQSDWKSPEGNGPIFVIDECHLAMPAKETPVDLEEWYSMHRHYNVDVLLITQSHGKVNVNIRDMVQTCYKVRKASAFGDNSKYMRLVTDGVRGPIMDEGIREYRSQFYSLWRSHTQGRAVSEIGAADVGSKIKKTKKWATILVAFGVIGTAYNVVGLFSDKTPKPKVQAHAKEPAKPAPVVAVAQSVKPAPVPVSAPVVVQAEPEQKKVEPFGDRGLHLTGCLRDREKEWCTLTVSQNGSAVFSITNVELERAGYKFEKLSDCVAVAYFGKIQRAVICDSPQVSMGVAGSKQAGMKPST